MKIVVLLMHTIIRFIFILRNVVTCNRGGWKLLLAPCPTIQEPLLFM